MSKPAETDERKTLTIEEATAMLPDGEYIHTFKQAGGVMLGCDWKREQVLEHFALVTPELSGPMATRMNHGIVCMHGNSWTFFATKP